MLINELKTLPKEVQDFVWDVISDFNDEISVKYSFDFDQFEFFNKLEDDILLKKTKVVDLPINLEKMPGEFQGDVRKLALQMAKEIFWPLQEHLEQVDRLILRLGGKVPRLVPLKKSRAVDSKELSEVFHGKVKDLFKRYEEFRDLRITPNKIINKKGLTVNPSVQNWIEDYIHFLGAGEHNSIERVKYISKSPNASKLNDKYKDSLRFLLLSYDKGVEFYFDRSKSLLLIEEHQKKEIKDQESEKHKSDFTKILDDFKTKIKTLEEQLLPSDLIISEAKGDVNKVGDILWQAIGIGDKYKAISCLALLIEKKSFDALIKEDNRFSSILKRFIGVKYGQSMERSLDENFDHLIVRRIFLEMILSDKLKLSEDDIFTVAFYLTNIVPDSGQLIYFDQKEQKFEWRIIQVTGKKFVWVDKL
ncbi:MAG: hypothetical protein HOE19_04755 [Candidatus Komeilibacteria bacterium]|jgi:hypothetical protein|nr:hypothetical protein [Candidatus Komeilibacteria bacterium]MBT4447979.1 hypothetical protein [Candidatus Komeilibacteria bacterium]